ncbi:MAG: glycosyltransferase [Gaiellaceae bacterium]
MSDTVTVAIPVLNGARYLDEVLTAVRRQEVDREVEILIVDSGSRDGSLEIARRQCAEVHEIPREEFSHGGTRNLIMELARGSHVAFLTQDATPAHERWLAALLEGFEQAPNVAAVFGPHEARTDASHMLKAEMERHFASWGEGRELSVQRLDQSPAGIAAYRSHPGWFTFLSSVNCCIARHAWEQVRFREVPYAEDQLLGRDLVEAGFAKVFHPDARVLHSHDYRPLGFMRRYFDEYRGLREVLGHREPAGPLRTYRSIRALTLADRDWLRRRGVRGLRLAWASVVSLRHHTLRMAGAILGSRARALLSPLRRALSLERRSTFVPVDLGESPLLGRDDDEHVTFEPNWGWEFVRRAYPARALTLEPHAGRDGGPLTLAWVVPPWNVGSGGHAVIFQLIAQMERRGHKCALFVFDPFRYESRHAALLRDEIIEHFSPIQGPVFIGLDAFDSADVAVATNWWTAYPVRDLPRCREKIYLVQDFEPAFYPSSSEAVWAEETYRMGYRCATYTPWLADLLHKRYGLEVAQLDCGTDIETYPFGGYEGREPGLVVVYGRQETPRRAVELAFAGLATLIERRPNVRVVVFGSRLPLAVPFRCENAGVISPRELAALYRRASAGVVFSLTNLSLVTQEMMASGLPVVELAGENVASVLGASGELAKLTAPDPASVADAVAAVLDEPEDAAAMAERARAFVDARTWTRASEQLETALHSFLSHGPARTPSGQGERATVTETLADRVGEDILGKVGARASVDRRVIDEPYARDRKAPTAARICDIWRDASSPVDRKRLALALGVHYEVPEVLERTGLTPAAPPEDVHSMSRGPLASGGSIYHADLVVDALAGNLGPESRVLDFGCSSGRVVRVLAAAYPEIEWYGCDPLSPAIAWAEEHIPSVAFSVSSLEPPLPYADSFFDAVYAISVWSHFAEGAAVSWLEEMDRILKPGGRLVLTTHGYETLSFYARNRIYPDESVAAIRDALYARGFHFEHFTGESGDWALGNPEWGMAFLTTEWLLARAAQGWRLAEFAPGRNEANQDVFVLERNAASVFRFAPSGEDARELSPREAAS